MLKTKVVMTLYSIDNKENKKYFNLIHMILKLYNESKFIIVGI